MKHKDINYGSIVFISYVKEMSILHTHTQHTLISDLFGDLKYYCLRGKSRRNWGKGLWYGVRIKHMITLKSIEFSLLDIYYTCN